MSFAGLAREAWEPLWPIWRAVAGCPEGEAPSHQACVVTSLALERALARAFPEIRWFTVGGRPTPRTPGAGCRSADGARWHPHLWVEGRRRGKPALVVDVTADQFGLPPVVVAMAPAGYRVNATPTLIRRYRAHEHHTTSIFLEALDAYMKFQSRA